MTQIYNDLSLNFEGGCRDPRTADLLKTSKGGMQGPTDGRILKGDAGIHEPSIWSEYGPLVGTSRGQNQLNRLVGC